MYRLAGGTWYWLHSSDGSFHALTFGNSGDLVVPGDYDNDGKTDQAVWRAGAAATFYVNRSTEGFAAFQFGTTGDLSPAYTVQVR